MNTPISAIERHAVATASVAKGERIDFWREAIRTDLLDLTFKVPRDVEFEASLVATQMSSMSFLSIKSSPSIVQRERSKWTGGGDDAFMFNFVFSGHIVAQQDGRRAIVGAGDGVMCTGARPFTFEIPKDTHLACISLPREILRRSIAGIDGATATNFALRSELTPLVARYAGHFLDDVDDVSPAGACAVARNFMDLLVSMTGQVISDSRAEMPEQRSVMLIRVRDYIEQHLGDPGLNAERVAAAMNLSHRYINRLLEAEDTSLSKYIWQRRLDQAAIDLAAPALSGRGITQIAVSNGFSDMSHFSKAFRTRFQCSPRDFRRAGAGNLALAT